MSLRLIALSPDLERLRSEGYDIVIRGGYLIIQDIPYVAGDTIARGRLISTLNLSGERTDKPDTHVCFWEGQMPCHRTGEPINAFENKSAPKNLGHGLDQVLTFSAKADYRDYHHKMTTYLARIVGEAQKLDSAMTAQTFPVYVVEDEAESVFRYVDTASSRSGIGALNEVFARQRIAIVGLGGTGSYILDLVAKTQVNEIHLFDGDTFSTHNAFRSPGAASLEALREKPAKVAYLAAMYDAMRRGIYAHPEFVTTDNVECLQGFDFVFLCVDKGQVRGDLSAALERLGISFIDVGLGVTRSDQGLGGLLQVTLSTPASRDSARRRLSVGEDDGEENEYKTNVQIAELNALNAALAVIRWKKLSGFYRDGTGEHFISYAIAPNALIAEDDV